MTTPGRPVRTALCDAVKATGVAHRLGPAPILLVVAGRTLRFCSMIPCLLTWLTNRPYEDRASSAIGLAEGWPA